MRRRSSLKGRRKLRRRDTSTRRQIRARKARRSTC